MTKIALITDTHLGVRNDSLVFHENFRRSAKFFFDYLDEHKIGHCIHLGDLYDRRKYVNFVTAKVCREAFLDEIQNRRIATYVILGNHDVYYKDTNSINALDELVAGRYPYVGIIDKPYETELDGCKILMLPWITADNREACLEMIKNTTAEVCMGHLELKGFTMFGNTVSDHGDDGSIFNKFDLVFTGHYHHKSSKGNIHYIGGFGEHTWADYNDPRGFTIFDTETRQFEFVRLPYRLFHMIAYDDVKHTDIIQKIQATDYSKYKDCYLKVVCVNRTNPYAFDMLLDKLYKAQPVDISVIEDISTFSENDPDSEIDQAEDTVTILDKYITGLTLPVNTDKMKSYMRDVYTEALSVEHIE